jgi:Domain of unknown function (DUF4259)
MGAWGTGSFENDTALDWAAGVKTVQDVREPFARLKAFTDSHPDGGDAHVEADLAAEIVAAAETVAMLMGRKIPVFPVELAATLENAGTPDDLLFHQARNAVLCVLRNSEVAELWQEAAEEGEPNEWNAEITRLIDRLNPDLKAEPWDIEDIEFNAKNVLGKCCFATATSPATNFSG